MILCLYSKSNRDSFCLNTHRLSVSGQPSRITGWFALITSLAALARERVKCSCSHGTATWEKSPRVLARYVRERESGFLQSAVCALLSLPVIAQLHQVQIGRTAASIVCPEAGQLGSSFIPRQPFKGKWHRLEHVRCLIPLAPGFACTVSVPKPVRLLIGVSSEIWGLGDHPTGGPPLRRNGTTGAVDKAPPRAAR